MVEADSGAIGGKDSHEFMVVTESGEEEIICCPDCDYVANAEKAQSVKESIEDGEALSLEEPPRKKDDSADEKHRLCHESPCLWWRRLRLCGLSCLALRAHRYAPADFFLAERAAFAQDKHHDEKTERPKEDAHDGPTGSGSS